jgi:selenocysteine lyase/cysteine desulfurase
MKDPSAEFPGIEGKTYLNSCAHGLLPRRTRAAIEAHLDAWQDLPDWNAWNEEVEKARRAFAALVHARPEEVAVVANASEGIGAVMSALVARAGRPAAIVTTEADFPTGPALARRQQEARGFEHRHVPLARLEDAIREDAALVSVPYVASFTGRRLDVRGLARAARAEGVPLLVDAFQACGTFDIDVKRDDVDFLVTGVYKWLLSPAGLAFLYVRPDRHGLVPTTSGWQAQADPYAFDPLGPLAPDARRFQSGAPAVAACAAAAVSLDLVRSVGLAEIERADRALVDLVLAGADERKLEVLTPRDPRERASIVTFLVPDAPRALEALARERVIVNSRLGGLRVSPHFYNQPADVERLFEVLDRLPRAAGATEGHRVPTSSG